MKKIRALVLISGGLDSILAAKLLLEEGIEVKGLIFKSLFFNEKKGVKACQQLGIDYQVVDICQEHLDLVKNPQYGSGKGLNPCIDCHLLMLKKSALFLRRDNPYEGIIPSEGLSFVATGEVLGSRPFSQTRRALEALTKESGLGDRLVRPLSARLLPKTLPEKKGWLSKKCLLSIQGRKRETQMKLAKKYKLEYPQPSGGCILTELEYVKKLKKMIKNWPKCSAGDVKLLRLGRIYWPPSTDSGLHTSTDHSTSSARGSGQAKTLVVLGRNKEENKRLEKVAQSGDQLIIPEFPGPTALVRGGKVELKRVKKLILKHSKPVKNLSFTAG